MITLRELTEPAEFQRCLELQREGFGWSEIELMPMRFFVVSRHIGGLVLGAFEGSTLVGFLSVIPGVRDGIPYWHSHMLAVAAGHRLTKLTGFFVEFIEDAFNIRPFETGARRPRRNLVGFMDCRKLARDAFQ